MISGTTQSRPVLKAPAFEASCWFLGMMAFGQLLIAGMALATRLEQSREVRIVEKEVFRPVAVHVPMATTGADPSAVARPSAVRPTENPSVQPTPLAAPQVADPLSERLVREARELRVAGDMMRAVPKLQAALDQSPDDPSVYYELGLVHEQMGVVDTAASYYQKVFEMGVSGAGSLYQMAATKLRDGFEQPDAMMGKLSLGRVRIFKSLRNEDGQRVILTIPVQKSPTDEFEVKDIAVSVIFFNRTTQGEIVQLEDNSWVKEQWVTLPFDWVGGEESLRMIYTIPSQDDQTAHLFGGREYYGQVVSLTYKGEVLDVQAWPRDLAARIPRMPTAPAADLLLPEFQDSMPPDFDPAMPLLPALPAAE